MRDPISIRMSREILSEKKPQAFAWIVDQINFSIVRVTRNRQKHQTITQEIKERVERIKKHKFWRKAISQCDLLRILNEFYNAAPGVRIMITDMGGASRGCGSPAIFYYGQFIQVPYENSYSITLARILSDIEEQLDHPRCIYPAKDRPVPRKQHRRELKIITVAGILFGAAMTFALKRSVRAEKKNL